MARFPKPAEGSWTEHYPNLGTEPMSYEDSISPEFYQLEREAIFRRAWLKIGRIQQIPRTGSYFTREIPAAGTSIIVVRDGEDVRAFHNICRHRGNKLVWTDFPREESTGTARQFVCKYHGWRYGIDGSCTFVQQEGEFFDLDKADYSLVPVHCDTFAGFIFVNFAKQPSQSLREYLGPLVLGIEDYPFNEMTDRYEFRVECRANWKVFSDAFMEFYHAPVVHLGQHPPALRTMINQAGYEAPHYQIDSPHALVTTAGALHRVWEMPPENVKPADRVTRSGLFGPWDHSDLGELPPGINPGKIHPWGLSSFQCFPNFQILIWEAGWYNTQQFWPTSYNSLMFEGDVYSLPAKNASDRVGREMAAVAFKEYALQDANTLEATQMGLEARVIGPSPLNDQEVLVRNFHKVVGEWVDNYRAEQRASVKGNGHTLG
jgi:phenylpropionate dioxygenase-like ring-hydroxylating dioxygenase large terminal subunit